MNSQPFNPVIASYQYSYKTIPQSNFTPNIVFQQRPATTSYTAPAVNKQTTQPSAYRAGCCGRK